MLLFFFHKQSFFLNLIIILSCSQLSAVEVAFFYVLSEVNVKKKVKTKFKVQPWSRTIIFAFKREKIY